MSPPQTRLTSHNTRQRAPETRLAAERREEARRDHFDFTIDRHEVAPLADRIWQLRHQYTSYDAACLALAEALDAPLYTCDAKLDAGGHDATIRLVKQSR